MSSMRALMMLVLMIFIVALITLISEVYMMDWMTVISMIFDGLNGAGYKKISSMLMSSSTSLKYVTCVGVEG
jgi:hypothetical protein